MLANCPAPQEEKAVVHSRGEELLSLMGDIIERLKKIFKDLLNPHDHPTMVEAETGDSEMASFITQDEVTEYSKLDIENICETKRPSHSLMVRPRTNKCAQAPGECFACAHLLGKGNGREKPR
ncbi:hypothetical protein ILYODFUR_030229 [Ilyodon furcidens]|uniref:Uncharacterized protein n=1 Tax=Ilyodon furcidens TaxID=33524 RepID=A0ABV0UK99_9TELE